MHQFCSVGLPTRSFFLFFPKRNFVEHLFQKLFGDMTSIRLFFNCFSRNSSPRCPTRLQKKPRSLLPRLTSPPRLQLLKKAGAGTTAARCAKSIGAISEARLIRNYSARNLCRRFRSRRKLTTPLRPVLEEPPTVRPRPKGGVSPIKKFRPNRKAFSFPVCRRRFAGSAASLRFWKSSDPCRMSR